MKPKSNLIDRIFKNRFKQDMHSEEFFEAEEGDIDTQGFPTQQGVYQRDRY